MPRYHLALTLVPGVGPVAAGRVIAAFPNLADAFGCDMIGLRRCGLSVHQAEAVARFADFAAVDRVLADAERTGQRIVLVSDPGFPAALRTIDGVPPVLFIKGKWDAATDLAVTVVGTRRPTLYGEKVARRLGAALARAGICTVSGGARGIDAMAHEGALAAEGRTVVVCGTGLDVAYPPEHVALFERVVAAGGALVSEMPPGTPPSRGAFPRRNRLLAALGRATVVVEAGVKSGALITARLAMEQGKTVLAVPGPIDSGASRGPNRLIRDGAKPLLEILDVVEEVLHEHLVRGRAEDEAFRPPPPPPPPPGDAGKVWQALRREPGDTDMVVERTGLGVAKVNAALVELELSGRITRRAGNTFFANLEDS